MNDYRNNKSGNGWNRNYKPYDRSHSSRGTEGPQGNDAVWAPYNFVPLSKHVWLPDWGAHVAHDIPFGDGYCGEIDIEITAETPIVVGGGKSRRQAKGEMTSVGFFLDADGKPALPGSTLRGVIRNTAEIASFSRFRTVDDKTYAVRDLTAGGRFFYNNRLTDTKSERRGSVQVAIAKSRAGFLYVRDGNWYILPCKYGRIEHRLLREWKILRGEVPGRANYSQKMGLVSKDVVELWVDPKTREDYIPSQKGRLLLKYVEFHAGNSCPTDKEPCAGDVRGLVVLTGQVPNKHREFVFYGYRDGEAKEELAIDGHVMQAFLSQNSEDAKDTKTPWGYWWSRLKEQRIGPGSEKEDVLPGIPVFFIGDGTGVKKLGLAQMFKMAYDFSTHDMISHTSGQHLEENGFDLADLIFGAARTDGSGSLKGRVSFGLLKAITEARETSPVKVVLNSPKPSFYPFYVEQEPASKSLRGDIVNRYNTYMEGEKGASQPQLRGWKRYIPRHMPTAGREFQSNSGDLPSTDRVATEIKPLPAGTRFAGKLRFHNLREAEIGLLVTALGSRFNRNNDDSSISGTHLIGMGKPYGFGRVTLRVTNAKLESNVLKDGLAETVEGADAIRRLTNTILVFVSTLEQGLPAVGSWYDTDQIRALAQLASVEASRPFASISPQSYMPLPQFSKTKSNSRALPRLPKK
jgi:CRISPR-associated protein (TIGR03986 family)